MNALRKLLNWYEPPSESAREFPPEAYSYDGPIEKEAIASLQKEADAILNKKKWTTIERIGDEPKR